MKKAVVIAFSILLAVAILGGIYFVFLNEGKETNAASGEYWPDGAWRTSTPETQGMDSAVLADMVNAIEGSDIRVDSVTIIRNGYLVCETYFYPYQKGLLHSMNSCTKSVISAMTGMAIEEGDIHGVNDKILDYYSDSNIANVDSRKRDITIRDMLTMTSGLDWEFINDESTSQMIQTEDWAKYTLDLPMREQPGTSFTYSNGATQVMSDLLNKVTGKEVPDLFLEKFKRLGITDIYWSDNKGNTVNGFAGLFMHPDDMAKFGYLYLKKGSWSEEQLISEQWVEESTRSYAEPGWTPLLPGYGYYWWITQCDGYTALGHGGNYICVIPEQELVVVFTGGIYNNTDLFYPAELVERYIIPSIKSDSPLENNNEASLLLQSAVDAAQGAPAVEAFMLPDTALHISGRTYAISGLGTLTFHFQEGSNQFTFDLNSQLFTGGLNGVPCIIDAGDYGTLPDHNHIAVKGEWISEDTLQVQTQGLEDGYVDVYDIEFEGDSIVVAIKSSLGFEQTLSGSYTG